MSGHRPRIAAVNTGEDRFGKLAFTDAQAACRKTSPNTLSRVLSGALGAIARKSMLQEPELRHSSARALADDLILFLNGHPVRGSRATGPYWC